MNRSSPESVAFAILLAAVLVAGAGSYFAFRSDEQRRTRLRAEVPAEIVEAFEQRGRNVETGNPRPVHSVRVGYRYTIADRTFERTIILNSVAGTKFKVGVPAKVCYNPQQVEEAELFEAAHRCAQ